MKFEYIFFVVFILSLFLNQCGFSQGVSICPLGTPPDNSAILEIKSVDKGFLPPRLTSLERDAIENPAEGLIIYNTDVKCLQYNFGTPEFPGWICTDGTNCEPQPLANAGPNQFILEVTNTLLAANSPGGGETGQWEIISGEGGTISDINDPGSEFIGIPNEQYLLRWTINNICGQHYDDVVINFQLNCPSVGDELLGGIVAYIIPGEGCTGIVATLQDQAENVQWGCRGQLVGTFSEIGEGQNNTAAIISFHDNLPNYYGNPQQCHAENDGNVAAKFCEGNINGFSDWFLPSIEEVTILRQNLYLQGYGNFAYSGYWSSTEGSATSAHLHFMGFENPSTHLKTAIINNVRCVRYFSE